MNKILVHQPSHYIGNIGDAAIMKAIESEFDNIGIKYIVPLSAHAISCENPENYSHLVYVGCDCLAHYNMNEGIINKFINAGKRVYFINVSWSKNARNVEYLAKINKSANVQMIFRDELSMKLFEEMIECVNKPILAADLAILCPAHDVGSTSPNMNWIKSSNKPVIGINIHRDYGKDNGRISDEIIKFINNHTDYRYLLIPHDTRKKEREILIDFAKEIGNEQDYFISGYMQPEHEKTIFAEIEMIITCRLHVAIIAHSVMTPTMAISYNGVKAKGMFKHWDMEDFVISPDDIDQFESLSDELLANRDRYHARIMYCDAKVREMAKKQIDIITGDTS